MLPLKCFFLCIRKDLFFHFFFGSENVISAYLKNKLETQVKNIITSSFFCPSNFRKRRENSSDEWFCKFFCLTLKNASNCSSPTLDMLVIEDTGALCQSSSPTKVLIPCLMIIRCHCSLNLGVMQN